MKRAEIEITGARAELTTAPPDPIRVGAGTAFFVGGRMPAGWAGEGFAVRAVRREFPVEARAMPEERSYDAGELWWTMLTIPGPVEGDEPLPDPLPDPRAEAAEHPPWGPLVAICMATYEPDSAQLRRQLDSIRSQTHENWICVISDDHSSPDRLRRARATGCRRRAVPDQPLGGAARASCATSSGPSPSRRRRRG